MRRSIVSLFSFLAIALIALTGCQEPQNTVPGSVKSISVRVMDSTDSKTITPEGNVNISHYVITVVNEAEGINQSSGYLPKGSIFMVSNVPAGTWYAKVDAYIDRGEGTYVKVASDQSEAKAVAAGTSTTFDLVLDALDAVASGDVRVTLKIPKSLTTFWYQYTITGMTDEEFTHTSELLRGTRAADGFTSIFLDADAIGLMQGAYHFEITIQDKETSPTVTRKGVDVMRLINGLEAKGTIDLSSYESDRAFEVTITDKIGDILTPEIQDGKEVYNLLDNGGNNTLEVTLAEPLTAGQTIEWYVDGELDETVDTDKASSGKYVLTFGAGNYNVTAIVKDGNSTMAVGSINPFQVSFISIEEQMFTFELEYGRYTVTGLAKEVGEFEMPESGVLEIPARYQGTSVTSIGIQAFSDRKDIVGSVTIPDSVTSIKNSAFYSCKALTSINIPNSVTSIGTSSSIYSEGAFANCTSLETVKFGDASQLETIISYTFGGCISLTSINIPNSVTSIEGHAFNGCTSLTSIKIPDSVTYIGSYAFINCSSLTSINIPDGVTSIGSYAFDGCSALTDIYCEATSQPEDWAVSWLGDCGAEVHWGCTGE